MTDRRRLQLSLRWRLAAAFGLGSFLLSSVLAIATWNLSSGYLLRQREQSAVRQAEVNARVIDEEMRRGGEGLDKLLTGLTTGPDSTILLYRPGELRSSGRQIDPSVLPPRLLELARDGIPARQRLVVDGIPVVAVTLPVTAGDVYYVELSPTLQLDRTFRFLSAVLIAGTVVSGLLGVALGAWAGRRALRPLTELTAVAHRIAGGDLRSRLPERADPDLAPLARTFNATADQLEQRALRDARFASDVSHELRSPLTTMMNAAAVLRRRREEIPGTAGRATDLLTSEVDRFARMVVDLLEISRSDQQVDDRSLEPVDLGGLVRHVLATRSDAAAPEVEVDPCAPLVIADRRRLDRVVNNLLDNAERHAGGPVRVAVLRSDHQVRLEIDDRGPGVPAELREQIFERFARGTQAGSRGTDSGSGLGLALVAEHVRRHGGRAWVQDRPGGGARFVVEIPEATTR
ncbi:HAMP domain-containing sensor histidine kinase [Lentzea sp. BCCO 10_0856]|uniref:histidine kinase n=1 Tax=Lentzea miocenica TaxID=3095431 RepID=A0ABU4TAC9_9PSEU|nr:HAMP domain-containing sensor histidine kinase [Lentzea sp. BCCO 10_0856]MDX8034868.1 HAMP domain-containing sensor histidine kinase [Lentzea sp. BCCO 10_0856]